MFEEYYNNYKNNDCHDHNHNHPQNDCPQLPGTILRINIPAGATINLLNLLEITSPGGICLILRSPLFSGANTSLESIIDVVKKSGATVHFEQY